MHHLKNLKTITLNFKMYNIIKWILRNYLQKCLKICFAKSCLQIVVRLKTWNNYILFQTKCIYLKDHENWLVDFFIDRELIDSSNWRNKTNVNAVLHFGTKDGLVWKNIHNFSQEISNIINWSIVGIRKLFAFIQRLSNSYRFSFCNLLPSCTDLEFRRKKTENTFSRFLESWNCLSINEWVGTRVTIE